MLKRQSGGSKTSRKKRKGNATYGFTTLDPTDDENMAVEDIRVYNVSASEKGRVRGSRRTLKHYHQLPPSLPEEPSTSKKQGGDEEAVDVEAGTLADSEFPPAKVDKQRLKRNRVRVVKENDSVSE